MQTAIITTVIVFLASLFMVWMVPDLILAICLTALIKRYI
jgi:hypothetical protein